MQGVWKNSEKNCDFLPISRFISKRIQDRAMFTVADYQYVVRDLLNGAILIDFERPLTNISRSHAIIWCWMPQKRTNSTIYRQLEWNAYRDLRRSQGHHFKWFWVTLSHLTKYSMTGSIARSLYFYRLFLNTVSGVITSNKLFPLKRDQAQSIQWSCDYRGQSRLTYA